MCLGVFSGKQVIPNDTSLRMNLKLNGFGCSPRYTIGWFRIWVSTLGFVHPVVSEVVCELNMNGDVDGVIEFQMYSVGDRLMYAGYQSTTHITVAELHN